MFNYYYSNSSSSLWNFPDRSLEPDEPAELPEPNEIEILNALEDGIKTPNAKRFFYKYYDLFELWVFDVVDRSEIHGDEELEDWAYAYIDLLMRDAIDAYERELYYYNEEDITMEEVLADILTLYNY